MLPDFTQFYTTKSPGNARCYTAINMYNLHRKQVLSYKASSYEDIKMNFRKGYRKRKSCDVAIHHIFVINKKGYGCKST